MWLLSFPFNLLVTLLLSFHRSEANAASDDSPRQAELPYPMSAWTWDTQEAAAAWMVVPTGDAGLGLQVSAFTSICWFWSLAQQSWSGTASLSLLFFSNMLTQDQMLFLLHNLRALKTNAAATFCSSCQCYWHSFCCGCFCCGCCCCCCVLSISLLLLAIVSGFHK